MLFQIFWLTWTFSRTSWSELEDPISQRPSLNFALLVMRSWNSQQWDTDYFGIDNVHPTRRYCSRVSCTCQQACIICTCKAQTITSSSWEVSSIWSESTRCSLKGVRREETERSRGCRTSISWWKSVTLHTLAIFAIVNYGMYNKEPFNDLGRSIFKATCL